MKSFIFLPNTAVFVKIGSSSFRPVPRSQDKESVRVNRKLISILTKISSCFISMSPCLCGKLFDYEFYEMT